MKRLLLPVSAAFLWAAAPIWAQQGVKPQNPPQTKIKKMLTVLPMKESQRMEPDAIEDQAASGATIPFWHYSVVAPVDGRTYQGTMVGRNPTFHGHRTTIVPTSIIPVKLTFADTGTLFDPTTVDSCIGDSVVNVVTASPMFQNVNYTMNGVNVGATQYVDAFQRANFWKNVAGTPYHTLLGKTVLPPVNVTVPVAYGSTNGFGCVYGTMDLDWWDNYAQTTLIPSLASHGVSPGVFPIFLFDSVFEYIGDPSQCCVLGYHSAFNSNNLLQTYAISSFDTSGAIGGDISVTSHEIAEWLDDPDTNNATPAWGYVGQVYNGCQANLEVGDPLSPGFNTPTNPFTVTMPNGFTYTLQELAYFSWFFRQSPSIGSGNLYSDNTTFRSAQSSVCQ